MYISKLCACSSNYHMVVYNGIYNYKCMVGFDNSKNMAMSTYTAEIIINTKQNGKSILT